jgi:hypothetical protein
MNLVCLKGRPKGSYVYIGRGGPLGNPFSHLPVSACDDWARGNDGALPKAAKCIPPAQRTRFLAAVDALHEDDVLGCYCQAGTPCHGLVIMRLWAERRAVRP